MTRLRLVVVLAASLATAAAVAVAGLIGFVGIIMPHTVRLLVGGSYRSVLPLSVLFGASFLIIVDVLARTVVRPGRDPDRGHHRTRRRTVLPRRASPEPEGHVRVEERADVTTALDVRDLSVELGKRAIVSDVGLDVPTGGWLCIIGPNGAGKTTLVHAIAGLLHHTGSVRMWGRPLETRGRRERARTVALVPQLPAIPESFTVEQYVLLGRTPHLGPLASEGARDLEAVATALERLDLGWAASRSLDSLSGGELRRAVLARAIAQEAPLLLLDEPTTGLDIAQQLRVLELVDELGAPTASRSSRRCTT